MNVHLSHLLMQRLKNLCNVLCVGLKEAAMLFKIETVMAFLVFSREVFSKIYVRNLQKN